MGTRGEADKGKDVCDSQEENANACRLVLLPLGAHGAIDQQPLSLFLAEM